MVNWRTEIAVKGSGGQLGTQGKKKNFTDLRNIIPLLHIRKCNV